MPKVEEFVPAPPPKEYMITLNREEAEMLCAVVGSIIGRGPLRNFTDNLYHQLDKLLDPDGNDLTWSDKYNIVRTLETQG